MPAIRVVEALRAIEPVVDRRNLQISDRNIRRVNALMRASETATIATAGLGAAIDIRA